VNVSLASAWLDEHCERVEANESAYRGAVLANLAPDRDPVSLNAALLMVGA
jgi:hypothetical protein